MSETKFPEINNGGMQNNQNDGNGERAKSYQSSRTAQN